MKSKTIYLEGVSQNSDTLCGSWRRVYVARRRHYSGSASQKQAFGCLAKRQVHRGGSCSRGRKRSSHWKYKLETTECAELCRAACGTLTANADGLLRTILFTLVRRRLSRTIYR